MSLNFQENFAGEALVGGDKWKPENPAAVETVGFFNSSIYQQSYANISNNGYTISGSSGAVVVGPSDFTVSESKQNSIITIDPAQFILNGGVYYGFADSSPGFPPQAGIAMVLIYDDLTQEFAVQVGNLATGDLGTQVTNFVFTATDELSVSYDNTGTHGTAYLHKNGVLVTSFELTAALTVPAVRLLTYFGSGDVYTINVVQTPQFPVTGATQYSSSTQVGNTVDPTSYPSDRANKAYEVHQLAAPLLSVKGWLTNGDIVIFNSVGEITEVLGRHISGTNYSLVAGDGTPEENGQELQAMYNQVQTLVGLSSTNRYTILVGPGIYEFSSDFDVDVDYIDIVSLSGSKDVNFTFTNPLYNLIVMANDVILTGISTGVSAFIIGDNLPLMKVNKCSGGTGSFGENVISAGTFTDCTAGDDSFGGGLVGSASGTFTNCTAGTDSFGTGDIAAYGYQSASDAAPGTFINCTSGSGSFGKSGTASGTFTNCIADSSSFGGTLIGKLYFCILKYSTFPVPSGAGAIYQSVDSSGPV